MPASKDVPVRVGEDDWAIDVDFAPVNLYKRLPAVLLLDTSASMEGTPIEQLNAGLKLFQGEFSPETGDAQAMRSVEVAMVSFGANHVRTHDLESGIGPAAIGQEFVEAKDFHAPELHVGGTTPLGPAMFKALELLEARKQHYRSSSIPYHRPWIFLITDGAPDPGWEESAVAAREAEKAKKAIIFPIGVHDADLQILAEFSSERKPFKLKDDLFKELFVFISNSVSALALSKPGEENRAINPDDIKAWTQFDFSS